MLKYYLEKIDVNDKEALLTSIEKEKNSFVTKGDILCSIETTKVSIEIEAEQNGYVEFFKEEFEKIQYGELLFVIKDHLDQEIINEVSSEIDDEKDNNITEKALKYIKANGIDINEVRAKLNKPGVIKLGDVEKLYNKSRYVTPNNRHRVIIIGAGSAGEVVADILLDDPLYEIVGFVDDNPSDSFEFYGLKIVHNSVADFPEEFDRSLYDSVIISFGGNLKAKDDVFRSYLSKGIKFINAIHKRSVISRNVKIGVGNVIGANAYIGTSSCIGDNNWIAANVNVDHHNIVGDSNLLGPNFTSPGIVKIGDVNKFGANASLSNNVSVGNNNVIMNNKSIFTNVTNDNIIK